MNIKNLWTLPILIGLMQLHSVIASGQILQNLYYDTSSDSLILSFDTSIGLENAYLTIDDHGGAYGYWTTPTITFSDAHTVIVPLSSFGNNQGYYFAGQPLSTAFQTYPGEQWDIQLFNASGAQYPMIGYVTDDGTGLINPITIPYSGGTTYDGPPPPPPPPPPPAPDSSLDPSLTHSRDALTVYGTIIVSAVIAFGLFFLGWSWYKRYSKMG